jgi:hypothetical protein
MYPEGQWQVGLPWLSVHVATGSQVVIAHLLVHFVPLPFVSW